MKVRGLDKLKYLIESDRQRLKYTPKDIVDDMLDLLPKELWSNPSATFLDICSKSGVFLDRIYWRLELGLEKIIPDDLDRSDHILTKQIFGLSLSKEMAEISRGVVYGTYRANHPNAFTMQFKDESGNIKVMERNVDTNIKHNYKDILKDATGQLFRDTVKEAFGDMKFDVVVGNPPYNNDMYLDFVQLGYNLLKDKGIMIMITPAKWQAKGGKKNEDFREKIVPRMKEIVYYPYTQDVFDVTVVGGITYYSVYKECQEKCTVSIKKNSKEVFYEEEKFDIAKGDKRHSYYNSKIEHIINKCAYGTRLSKTIFIDEHKNGKYMVKMSHLADDKKKSSCIGGFILTPIYIEEFGDAGQNKFILYRGTKEQCESFKSYVYTKFVRFMVAIGMCASSVRNTETWRFVPNPDAFDHIFTDDELYKKYNLTQDEINIIEAVVKERK